MRLFSLTGGLLFFFFYGLSTFYWFSLWLEVFHWTDLQAFQRNAHINTEQIRTANQRMLMARTLAVRPAGTKMCLLSTQSLSQKAGRKDRDHTVYTYFLPWVLLYSFRKILPFSLRNDFIRKDNNCFFPEGYICILGPRRHMLTWWFFFF